MFDQNFVTTDTFLRIKIHSHSEYKPFDKSKLVRGELKVKGHVWGFFGTAVCRPIVPLPPNEFLSFISRGATHHIGRRDLC